MSGTAGGGGHWLGLLICVAPGQGLYPYAETARHPASATVDYKSTIAALSDQRKNAGQEAEQERGGGEKGRRPGDEAEGRRPGWGQRADTAPAKHGFRFLPRLSAALALYVGQRTDETR